MGTLGVLCDPICVAPDDFWVRPCSATWRCRPVVRRGSDIDPVHLTNGTTSDEHVIRMQFPSVRTVFIRPWLLVVDRGQCRNVDFLIKRYLDSCYGWPDTDEKLLRWILEGSGQRRRCKVVTRKSVLALGIFWRHFDPSWILTCC